MTFLILLLDAGACDPALVPTIDQGVKFTHANRATMNFSRLKNVFTKALKRFVVRAFQHLKLRMCAMISFDPPQMALNPVFGHHVPEFICTTGFVCFSLLPIANVGIDLLLIEPRVIMLQVGPHIFSRVVWPVAVVNKLTAGGR